MVQLPPPPVRVTIAEDVLPTNVLVPTRQGPAVAKVTVKLEDAVAVMTKGGSRKVLSASGQKVMVWFALAIVKVWGTATAGLKLTLPDRLAVMVQLPPPVIVTIAEDVTPSNVLPVTEQAPAAAKVTVKLDDAVAVMAKGGSP